ncbi:uncharacterized protein F21D5.5 isoform X1 [Nasonia vitripennis]|uniref:PNK FHA domain-containing protein n=1 Tax=Nasonia vitripennis TaxID=7425 RepID=A0A7M7QSH6_NASVI|nr:uncharacterized protein F21D5.5 isoform X1 [Nasonia vitripennis]XP_032453022.1 uncharacterized protein F21D5.5 isoform X1 [Nasonia vitripennis]
MSSDTKSCYICSENKSMPPVYLPDKLEVFVGRSVDTKIADPHCSRKQVRLYASYEDHKVSVEQLGSRACGLNGFKTERGVRLVAQHGDRLEILYGKHPYKIEFNPAPKVNTESEKPKKRLLSQESEEEDEPQSSKKSRMSEDGNGDQVSMEADESVEAASTSSSNGTMSKSENGTWEHYSNKTLYVYTSNGCTGRSKIAAYDMDKTLIKTISGLEFPKDCNDWQLLYPEVPGKIKKFYEDGYKIVILSNQGNLGSGKITLKDFKKKIEKLVKKIGVPMQVYLAVGQSIYRKPRTGMWDFLVHQKNDGVSVDKENSFYIGDAAGRPANATRKKKDHSLADRLLALNLGLTFHTPEEHFLGHKQASYNAPSFHPKEASKNTVLYEPSDSKLVSDKQELVIMVGCPGSGKSHFAKTHLKNYYYINRDTLGNWQKCVAKTDEALAQGKSVVVDNTNPDKVSRSRYVQVAKKHRVPVRCFAMTLDKEHIKHNNMFRILTDPTHQAISDMIINSYIVTKSQLARRCLRFVHLLLLLCLRFYIRYSIRFSKSLPTSYRKNFTPPSEDEGFSEIVKINFVPHFKSEEDRRLYEMYLLG